jgi:hypothetical protein
MIVPPKVELFGFDLLPRAGGLAAEEKQQTTFQGANVPPRGEAASRNSFDRTRNEFLRY